MPETVAPKGNSPMWLQGLLDIQCQQEEKSNIHKLDEDRRPHVVVAAWSRWPRQEGGDESDDCVVQGTG